MSVSGELSYPPPGRSAVRLRGESHVRRHSGAALHGHDPDGPFEGVPGGGRMATLDAAATTEGRHAPPSPAVPRWLPTWAAFVVAALFALAVLPLNVWAVAAPTAAAGLLAGTAHRAPALSWLHQRADLGGPGHAGRAVYGGGRAVPARLHRVHPRPRRRAVPRLRRGTDPRCGRTSRVHDLDPTAAATHPGTGSSPVASHARPRHRLTGYRC
jgi:hypothetical protein